MKNYCLGLLFSPGFKNVVLTEKTHGPGEMAGKLNGIGGHVEDNESPLAAMVRETFEEIGVSNAAWVPFCSMNGEGWLCHCFAAVFDEETVILPERNDAGERVLWLPYADAIAHAKLMVNMRWLIPLATDIGVVGSVRYRGNSRGDR